MFKFIILLTILSTAVGWDCYQKTDQLPLFRLGISNSVIHGVPKNLPLLLFLNRDLFLGEIMNSVNQTMFIRKAVMESYTLEADFRLKFRCLNAEQRKRALENYEDVINEEHAAPFPKNFEKLLRVVPYFFRGLSNVKKLKLMNRNTRLEKSDKIYYRVIIGSHTKEINEALKKASSNSFSSSSSSSEDEED